MKEKETLKYRLPPSLNNKPDWITDKEWKTVQSVDWWRSARIQQQTLLQQKPLTLEEVKQMLGKAER